MTAGYGRTVATLGTAQLLAWASCYYLPAMLAAPMARDLGVSQPTVFAAFSAALAVSALLGPRAGAAIDRWGGRPVLMATNLCFVVGLAALAAAQGPVSLFAAWLLLGLPMGAGLYEAAFATLVRLYGHEARNGITGITLIAGFASTLSWPLTAGLEGAVGWRGACLAWAAIHLLLALPLNASLPRVAAPAAPTAVPEVPPAVPTTPPPSLWPTIVLSFVFAAAWFTTTAMATHLPQLLQAAGSTPAQAVLVGALIGPAQVAARLLDFSLLRRLHPLLSARLAAAAHPLGAALLAAMGPTAAPFFGVLHGAGAGMLTIAKGTLPLVFFGAQGYGQRQGLLVVPGRLAQALAPWLFGIALQHWGLGALALSAGLGLLALGALFLLPPVRAAAR
ncbi:MFS transporter [Aquabacterium sp. J223]|uniref:MFS transporter n=1 Tax=Aquabacterium sp. J223 TaxID=2898431 RepID=UPI0021ADB94E|nr:MFS transporter [Aquabacterium sp. J223]UUX94652.1 MFS transporter [Aquabacterium sp. J223]